MGMELEQLSRNREAWSSRRACSFHQEGARASAFSPWQTRPFRGRHGHVFEAAAHADQMTWTLQSTYKYQVDVKLFSKSPRWAWPANGSYGLEDSGEHDATISCQHGQKICYGAWVTGRDDLIWGAGMDGNEACSDCCYPCGSSNPHVSFSN
jgi:hypothetical protein